MSDFGVDKRVNESAAESVHSTRVMPLPGFFDSMF